MKLLLTARSLNALRRTVFLLPILSGLTLTMMPMTQAQTVPASNNDASQSVEQTEEAFTNALALYQKSDFAHAFDAFKSLAEQGHSGAQNSVGLMYDNAEGVEKDAVQAAMWYRKAADQNFAAAQFNLGVMYYNGQGVTQDDKEAVMWFTKAALQDNVDAQTNLGVMYSNGQGVARDFTQALMWYRKAALKGDPEVIENLQKLLTNLPVWKSGKTNLAVYQDITDKKPFLTLKPDTKVLKVAMAENPEWMSIWIPNDNEVPILGWVKIKGWTAE